jgi:hypothetical protein
MSQDPSVPNAVEQAVSRALRDNLERIQRTSDELHLAIADVVAACGSSRPTNALPPMLRAQTAAASLSAALDVLSRFVAVALQPGPRSPFESEIARIAGTLAVPEPAPTQEEEPGEPAPALHAPAHHAGPAADETLEVEAPPAAPGEAEDAREFNVSRLSAEEQELHRRANRVAKVSMQDI